MYSGTFDLVESCNEATSLAELLRIDSSNRRELVKDDPFASDPLLDVTEKPVVRLDPFADDPGFGVEFDLLQRTLNGFAFKGIASQASNNIIIISICMDTLS